MIEKYSINRIAEAVTNRTFHTINMWNRLEGRPRKDNFERALKAEIRDPLWMLTKQWQMGEFRMDDAGSPAGAKVHVATTMLNKYKPANFPARSYDSKKEPLEAMVEQQIVPFSLFKDKVFSLDLRIMMGRQWIKMLKKSVGNLIDFFLANGYGVTSPADPDNKDDAFILSQQETWQDFTAAAGRKIDGYKVYQEILKGTNIGAGSGSEAEIAALADDYKDWVEKFFMQPGNAESAWLPSRLEYQFACSAPEGSGEGASEKIYKAEEYYSGRLDWFNFSITDSEDVDMSVEGAVDAGVQETLTNSFVPSNIDYGGMPDTRWWTFENNKTYIGDIKPNTHEIGKLLFSEFTLLYANDWFLIPQDVKGGTISHVKGLVVTNVFGERTWINPTGGGPDDDWMRWTMFTISKKGKDLQDADNSLLVLPTVPKIQEGKPIEQFVMIRDEIANMVWAIETDISTPSGRKDKAAEAARDLTKFYKRVADASGGITNEPEATAAIRYKIMSSVPENWIPFIPVHIENDSRNIQLQRAAMPRIIPGQEVASIERVHPRTTLLREGLDNDPQKPYYIFEEEVPRAGILVSRSYQRTRWYNGKTFLWLGIHKKTGRGEGSSGLRFDYLMDMKT
jgi:hypothetical protein